MNGPRLDFHQLEIPSAQLRVGVYGPHNRLVPWGPIAILRPPAESLSQRAGIVFDDSHDDLGDLKIALAGARAVGHQGGAR